MWCIGKPLRPRFDSQAATITLQNQSPTHCHTYTLRPVLHPHIGRDAFPEKLKTTKLLQYRRALQPSNKCWDERLTAVLIALFRSRNHPSRHKNRCTIHSYFIWFLSATDVLIWKKWDGGRGKQSDLLDPYGSSSWLTISADRNHLRLVLIAYRWSTRKYLNMIFLLSTRANVIKNTQTPAQVWFDVAGSRRMGTRLM